ncbi:MAG: ErpK protein [Spirochaetales bacterium]|nr:ErpK protein [Spirochaetales bacterium]
MARTKSLASLDAQITKAQEDLVKAKAKYDTVAGTLEKLQNEKKELQARQIMKAFIKSGKSFRQIMNFLDTGQN